MNPDLAVFFSKVIVIETQAIGFIRGHILEVREQITLPKHNEHFDMKKMEFGSGVEADSV